jgi:hypothetical protein
MEYDMNRQELRDPVKRKAVASRAAAFFDYADATFYVWNMLTFTGEVDARAVRDGLDKGLQGSEFAIGKDNSDAESSFRIKYKDLVEGFENAVDFSVRKVAGRGEIYLAAQSDEKWNFVHKKNVDWQAHVFVQLENIWGNFNQVAGHMV